jgi:hypothetical protein
MFRDDPDGHTKARWAIKELVWEYPTHEFAIGIKEARRLGLNVTEAEKYDEWNAVWEIFSALQEQSGKVIKLVSADALLEGGSSVAGNTTVTCSPKEEEHDHAGKENNPAGTVANQQGNR